MKELIHEVGRVTGATFDSARYLMIASAFEKTSLFLFSNHGMQPTHVVKIPQTESAGEMCAREYFALASFARLDIQAIEVARPSGTFEFGGKTCFIQTTVFGKPLLATLPVIRRAPNPAHFSLVAERLIELYRRTSRPPSASGMSSSTCFQHGDFWLGNLAVRDQVLVVHDLEYFSCEGKPLYDLLHFGVYYQRVLNNMGKVRIGSGRSQQGQYSDERVTRLSEEDVEEALLSDSPIARLMKRAVRIYADGCGLSKDEIVRLVRGYVVEDRGLAGFGHEDLVAVIE